MKCLYLTFNNTENKTGLFYSTHARIKHSIPLLTNYFIFNIQFYDTWFLTFLKKLLKIKPKKKGAKYFTIDNLRYNNIWIKRNIFSAVNPWLSFEKWRVHRILCNEFYISDKKIDLITEKAKQFDFIMAHWGYPIGRIAMKVSMNSQIPYFVTFHGSDINVIPKKNSVYKKYINEVLKNASMNFFVSEALYCEAKKMYKYFSAEISPNGISDNFILKQKDSFKQKNNNTNIVFIGNLNDDKRADKLPNIIKTVTSKTNKKIDFVIIGKGQYEKLIKNELKSCKASVSMTGFISRAEILEHLKNADLLILPSRREGLPLVILEAIACNVIPVASNVGGLSEILESDFLVDVTDSFINDFSDRIIKIIEKKTFPSLKIDDYTWNNILKKEINFIYKTLNAKNSL